MLLTAFYFFDLLPFAIFFGIAVYMWMAPYYKKLSARAFTEFFQGVDPYMKIWARNLVLAELLLSLTIAVVHTSKGQWAGASLAFVVFLTAVASLVIAVRGNVPLNIIMTTWDPRSPPADWAVIRDRWFTFHHWRGCVETLGFLLLLIGAFCYLAKDAAG
ncbi:MAG: hypothetical protein ACAI34_04510, partial [Verrucomicrobium sp.]